MSKNSEHNVNIVWNDASKEKIDYPNRNFNALQQRVRLRKRRIRVVIGGILLIVLIGIFTLINLMKSPVIESEIPNSPINSPQLSSAKPFDWSVVDTITTRQPVPEKKEIAITTKLRKPSEIEIVPEEETVIPEENKTGISSSIASVNNQTTPKKQVITKDTTAQESRTSFVPSEFIRAYPTVGYDSLNRYLTEFINKELIGSNNESDTLKISFAIETDGHPSGIKLSIDTPDSVFMKIEEVVQNMPAWQPATANGVPIKTRFRLPLIIQSKTTKIEE